MAARNWTPEQRRRQAEAIQRWRPWEQSTGPRTEAGKNKAALNAWKGGERPALRRLAQTLREMRDTLKEWGTDA